MKLRKGLIVVLASVLMSAGVVAITGTPSYAADPAPMPTGVIVKLIVLGSGKCLEVEPGPGGVTSWDGQRLWQQPCNGSSIQNWTLYYAGSGDPPGENCSWWSPCPSIPRYQIVNQATGKCIDLNNGTSADGTPIQQWTCVTTANQQWGAFFGETDYTYALRNAGTGKCMDMTWDSYENGAELQEFHCTSYNEAQRFALAPL
jgi:hypothetical protein